MFAATRTYNRLSDWFICKINIRGNFIWWHHTWLYMVCMIRLTYCFSFPQWLQHLAVLLLLCDDFTNSLYSNVLIVLIPEVSYTFPLHCILTGTEHHISKSWNNQQHQIIFSDNITMLLMSFLTHFESVLPHSYLR